MKYKVVCAVAKCKKSVRVDVPSADLCMYHDMKKKGICTRCRKNKVIKGITYCPGCHAYLRNYHQKSSLKKDYVKNNSIKANKRLQERNAILKKKDYVCNAKDTNLQNGNRFVLNAKKITYNLTEDALLNGEINYEIQYIRR